MRSMAACSAFLFFIVTAAGCSKSQSPVASPVGPGAVSLEAKAGAPAPNRFAARNSLEHGRPGEPIRDHQ